MANAKGYIKKSSSKTLLLDLLRLQDNAFRMFRFYYTWFVAAFFAPSGLLQALLYSRPYLSILVVDEE
jgi:hypothetical protein